MKNKIKKILPPFAITLIRALRQRATLAVLIFLLFVGMNALKISLFYCFLVDVPVMSSFDLFFQVLFKNIVISMFIFIFLTWPRQWYWLAGFYCLRAFYMFVNLSYHFSVGGILRFSQYLGLYTEATELVKNTPIPLDLRMWIVVADLPFLLLLLIVYSRFSRVNRSLLFRPILVCTVITVLTAIILWNPLKPLSEQMVADPAASDVAMIKSQGLVSFTVMDILSHRKTPDFALSQRYGRMITSKGTGRPHPNIVCIQVESMDANIVDRQFHGVFVTPFLHKLSQECIYFPYALSYHEAGLTTDCEVSVINSLEPLADFPSIKLHNYRYINSMLKRFNITKYQTIAFHGNKGIFDNRTEAYDKMGFQKFYDMTAMGLREISWGAPDGAVFDFVKNKLRAQQEPFLYYIITMSSHEPFNLVNPYYRSPQFKTGTDQHTLNYFNSLSYVDKELRGLIASIRKLRPNSYIFMYGDHTPITDVGSYKKASFLYDDRLFEFVPLFIITPDSLVYHENECVPSFVDVAPTALYASGIPFRMRARGVNLLDLPLQDGVLSMRGSTYSRAELFQEVMNEKKNWH
ncbi:MAG TPA: LTA synthase family protein [Chitinivibrionales bacterium]|nr:LTA synthase family protein [Chitinivibrionales bacterium]